MQPLNQVPERLDRERTAGMDATFGRAMDELTPAGWETIMPFRIGHPTRQPGRSPRRPAEEVIEGAAM
jgi:hypothetical protein